MTAAVSEDWEAVVETLRSDLETVSKGEADDEEVRAAIDEVWTIVDEAEGRVGSVDAEQIGDVFGVDGGADAIDVESISREFVLEDPQRAAGLGRLVTLINVDEATGYDVGRLWRDEEVGSAGSDEGDQTAEVDSEAPSEEESAADGSTDDTGEAIRAELGDALSQFREKIQDAREGLDDSTDRAEDANRSAGGADDEGRAADSGADDSSSRRRSTSSRRGSTTFSTMPSERHDMGGLTHLSTMPGQAGRSRSSDPFGRGDEEDDGSDDQ